MKKTRIIVLMKAGLVEEIISNQPGIDLVILDKDVDGLDEEDIQEVRHNRENFKVRVDNPDVQHKAVATDALFNQIAL
jgi:hypothetical protein